MSDRDLRRLAWLVAAFDLGLVAAGMLLSTLDRHAVLPADAAPWPGEILSSLSSLTVILVGGLIAARLPRNPYGWVWLAMGTGFGAFQGFFTTYALHSGFVAPLPLEWLAVAIADLGWALGVSTLPFVLLLFPNGRPASSGWRLVARLAAAAGLLLLAVGWAPPSTGGVVPGMASPLSLHGPAGAVAGAIVVGSVLTIFACALLGALSLLLRFRAAGGAERQQLKWLAFGAAVLAAQLLLQQFAEPPGIWDSLSEALSLAVMPIAVAIAVLRHRLYDIDRLINRTLVYALLSAVLVGVYLGAVLLLQAPVRLLAGSDSQLVVVVSTLTVAALFNPLRRRVQALIDRAFYRQRYDARAMLRGLGGALRREVELEPLAGAILTTVATALQPARLSLWLRPLREDDSETPPG